MRKPSHAVAAGRLVAMLDKSVRDERNFCILWPSSRHPSPKIKAFVDFMASRVGNLGALQRTDRALKNGGFKSEVQHQVESS